VSGGADSILMAHLLIATGYQVSIAHCNFKLRGTESDDDAAFVQNFALQNNIPFYQIEFETEAYAIKNKLSIEMAARELRYNWFQQLKQEFDYQSIAIAHHADDVVETFHINLSRGSGIKGLTGIKAKNGDIARPLLFSSRKEILAEIAKIGLSYRTDSSNLESVYTRNKFRLDIIPQLEKINPSYTNSVLRSIQLLEESYQIINQAIDQARKICCSSKNGIFTIELEKLKMFSPLNTYIYELLQAYGINTQQAHNLTNSLDSTESLEFKTPTYLIIKDRQFIYALQEKHETTEVLIERNETEIKFPIRLQFTITDKTDSFKICKDSQVASLDLDLLKFPLTLRKWTKGDVFCPIGMKGKKKKLSDYFVDAKLSAIQKLNAYILESDDKVVWLVGHRLDERFKITDKTKKILTIQIIN